MYFALLRHRHKYILSSFFLKQHFHFWALSSIPLTNYKMVRIKNTEKGSKRPLKKKRLMQIKPEWNVWINSWDPISIVRNDIDSFIWLCWSWFELLAESVSGIFPFSLIKCASYLFWFIVFVSLYRDLYLSIWLYILLILGSCFWLKTFDYCCRSKLIYKKKSNNTGKGPNTIEN